MHESSEPGRVRGLLSQMVERPDLGEPTPPCPDADLLAGFLERSLLARARERVIAHVADCLRCAELLTMVRECLRDGGGCSEA